MAKAQAKVVVAVAHSAGGDGTVGLIDRRYDEVPSNPFNFLIIFLFSRIKVSKRLAAVAFTDSVHSVGRGSPTNVISFVKDRTRNWVTCE